MDELYTLMEEPIKKATRKASSNWYGLMEPEEIESEIWIEILESPATRSDIENADPKDLEKILYNKAERICMGERDDYEHFTGNYRYSVNEAKALIEGYFHRSGEELMVELLDAEIAFERLSESHPHYAEIIFKRYALGEVPEIMADKMYYNKGMTKLTDYMNRSFKDREREYRDGPGTKPRIPRGYDPYEGN